jgi:RNA polymerase sigma-70 factor (ECF subfamily)
MGDAAVAEDRALRFERVYREHGDRLWRGLLLYARDPDVASDAVAEAFAQAIRRGDAILEPLAWVTRAAYRIAAGELRRRGETDHRLEDAAVEMPEPAAELAAALARLSPKQRASAILHLRDGYTLAEVAALIGSTPSAVGVHVHRARKRLRDLLGDDDA